MINDASGEKDYCLVFTLRVFISLLGFVKCLFYFFSSVLYHFVKEIVQPLSKMKLELNGHNVLYLQKHTIRARNIIRSELFRSSMARGC